MARNKETEKAPAASGLEAVLSKSKDTDLRVLFRAKEIAKKALNDEFSPANLAAFERAAAAVEAALRRRDGEGVLEDWRAVLEYLHKKGRQIEKTKFFDDRKAGKIKQTDGHYLVADVDRYALTLAWATTPGAMLDEAEARQRRKDEAEIRIKEATARREEIKTAALEGRYVLRELVDRELAAKALTLQSDLGSQMEAASPSLVAEAKKGARALATALQDLLCSAFNAYSRPLDIEVIMAGNEEDLERLENADASDED